MEQKQRRWINAIRIPWQKCCVRSAKKEKSEKNLCFFFFLSNNGIVCMKNYDSKKNSSTRKISINKKKSDKLAASEHRQSSSIHNENFFELNFFGRHSNANKWLKQKKKEKREVIFWPKNMLLLRMEKLYPKKKNCRILCASFFIFNFQILFLISIAISTFFSFYWFCCPKFEPEKWK